MPVYRVTFGFRQSGFSPTETYFTGDLSPTNLGSTVQALIDKRNATLYTNVEWVGVRIGVADGARRSALFPPGAYSVASAGIELTVPSRGIVTIVNKEKESDQARACLQCRLVFDTDRSVVRYFALPPDQVLGAEPGSDRLANDPGWTTAFIAWRDEIVSGRWQIKGRNRAVGFTEIPIENWTQQTAAPNNMGFVLPSLPASGIVVGDKVQVKSVRRKGTDKLSYNGRYIVDSINTTLIPDKVIYFLRGTDAGDPASVKLLGKVQKIAYVYFPIQKFYGIRAGVHKRGNSFGRVLGRRNKQASLDP